MGGHTVFCNPPYGRSVIDWVRKANEESQKPGTTIVMLLFARTDTKWFHDYVYGKAEVRFLKGRVKFGGTKNNAPFPSMIVIFKSRQNEKDTKDAGGIFMSEEKKYRLFPQKGMFLKEILPMFRGSSTSTYDESGTQIIICPECEEWTHVTFNAHSGLLDLLGDLIVTDIDADDGNIVLWVKTDEFNWFNPKEGRNERTDSDASR